MSIIPFRRIRRDRYSNRDGSWFQHSREVKKRDGRCLDCGVSAKDARDGYLVTHHIQSLSTGGMTNKMNMITLCQRCHAKRHAHLR